MKLVIRQPESVVISSYLSHREGQSLHFASAQVETVVGVRNGASSAINITVLAGSLNNAKAFSQHFQNFSAQVYHTIHHCCISASPCKGRFQSDSGPQQSDDVPFAA